MKIKFHTLAKTVSIDDINFIGQYCSSPDGQYILAWTDFGPPNNISRAIVEGQGQYLLVQGETIILRGRLERPNDGHIANNGNFIISDSMFESGSYGMFYAFNSMGQGLIKKSLTANLYNCAISDSGKYAILCQVDLLFLFDLESKKLLLSMSPESGLTEGYDFNIENGRLYLIYKELGRFAYDVNGQFLDSDKFLKARIDRGNPFEILNIIKDKLKIFKGNINFDWAKQSIDLLDKALSHPILNRYPETQEGSISQNQRRTL